MGQWNFQGASRPRLRETDTGLLCLRPKLRLVPTQRILAETHLPRNPSPTQPFILQGLKPTVTEAQITEEQRSAISRAGKDRYLTEGDFYDGYFYRDVEGHILPEHPKITQLITEWISSQNSEI